jgi:hypothetical protein
MRTSSRQPIHPATHPASLPPTHILVLNLLNHVILTLLKFFIRTLLNHVVLTLLNFQTNNFHTNFTQPLSY